MQDQDGQNNNIKLTSSFQHPCHFLLFVLVSNSLYIYSYLLYISNSCSFSFFPFWPIFRISMFYSSSSYFSIIFFHTLFLARLSAFLLEVYTPSIVLIFSSDSICLYIEATEAVIFPETVKQCFFFNLFFFIYSLYFSNLSDILKKSVTVDNNFVLNSLITYFKITYNYLFINLHFSFIENLSIL